MTAYKDGAEARVRYADPVNPHESGSEAATAFDQGVYDKYWHIVQPCVAPLPLAHGQAALYDAAGNWLMDSDGELLVVDSHE